MRVRLLLVLLATLIALPLVAQSNEVGLWYVRSQVDTTDDADARIKFNDISGVAFSLNHYWTRHIASEIAYSSAEGDGTLSVAGQPVLNVGDLKMKTLTITAQWHYSPKAMIDPYGGAGFVTAGASDLASSDLTSAGVDRIKIADDNGWVANAGVNFNVFQWLGFGVDAKYFRYRPRAKSSSGEDGRLDLNPLMLAGGVRVRF